MNHDIILKEPPASYYTTDRRESDRHDSPSLIDEPRVLFTLPYTKLIDEIANVFFPPNSVETSSGKTIEIHSSDARVDRFILFRSVWEPEFGKLILNALQDITRLVTAKYSRHFLYLTEVEKIEFLELLEKGKLTELPQYDADAQVRIFSKIHSAIAEGLFSEPGYGGNADGTGWYYSNFMTLEG